MKGVSVSVNLNGKSVIKDYRVSKLNKYNGTFGFGFNKLDVKFSDIRMASILPPNPVKKEKKKGKGAGAGGAGEGSDGAGDAGGGYGDDEGEEMDDISKDDEAQSKEEVEDYVCLKTTQTAARSSFCEDHFGGKNKNASACVTSFCDICCTE